MTTAEIRITGPPGTGKTTHLAERIRKAVQSVGAKNVVVCSFTRAAAAELVGRDLPVPRENVGTLHAFAFRSLGRPTIIEASTALLGDWNRQAPRGAQIAAVNDRFGDSGPDSAEVWDGMAGASATGVLWEGYVLARHRDPSGGLVKARRQFAELDEQWGAFREETGCVDFTGLIEDALRLCPHAPGKPLVFYVDEAQDFSALELALARQWGEATGYGFVMVGDGDQCIYEWTGADPRALAAVDLPEKRRPVLAQSYRVPFEVHRHAVAWVRQTPGRIDDPEYYPRRVDPSDPTSAFAIGSVERMASRIEDDPGGALVLAEASLAAGKSVMILATCGYMLERVVATAYDLGVPFGNRYRRRNRSWNPLAPPTRGVGLVEKVLAFLEGPEKWTARDLGKIASILKADDVFLRGRKKVAESYAKRDGADALSVNHAALELLFVPSAIEGIEARSMTWLGAHLVPKLHRRVEYLYRIAERYGLRALTHEPLLTIGTIHCSPPDEPVLTKRGPVPIGELQPDDRLVGYQRKTNTISGLGDHPNARGYEFERSERLYSGALITIETEATKTRVTPNHRVVACFDEDAFCERWVVYLMRRGHWWRMGVCTSAHRPYRTGGVSGRLATEQADAGWILGVYDTRREALFAESMMQARWGIPGLTFQSAIARSLSNEDLAEIHEAASPYVAPRAKELLARCHMSEDWPLYRRGAGEQAKKNMRGFFDTEAVNLLPLSGRIKMLAATGKKPTQHLATVTVSHYRGPVFGLDVPPHHYYVSGGAIVHNSVKGGEADTVLLSCGQSWAAAKEAIEERSAPLYRLMYVGMTRARERLVLCGECSFGSPSP